MKSRTEEAAQMVGIGLCADPKEDDSARPTIERELPPRPTLAEEGPPRLTLVEEGPHRSRPMDVGLQETRKPVG